LRGVFFKELRIVGFVHSEKYTIEIRSRNLLLRKPFKLAAITGKNTMTFMKAFVSSVSAKERFTTSLTPALLLSIAAAGVIAFIGVIIDYYSSIGDIAGNHYLSMIMNFSDIHSFYDGFFPIGYTMLLKLLVGKGFPAATAYYVNVILSFIMMIVTAWYLKKRNLGFLFPAWLCFFILFPRTFRYQITPGPDTAAMALFTIGAVLQLARCNPVENDRVTVKWGTARRAPIIMSIMGGICMGIAALFRYHVLVASIFYLASLFVFMEKDRKLTVVCAVAVIVFYLPQVAVNVLTGHGPLETYHAVNLYNLVYGVNWYHMDKLIPLPSAKSIVLGAPLLFIKHYLKGMIELLIFALPPILYGVLATPKSKKIGFSVGIFCVLYALFFGISASPRAVLLLIPVSVLFFVKILFTITLPSRIKRIAIGLTFVCGCLFLLKDAQKVAIFKGERDKYRKIEAFFIAHGVKYGKEVFTCDFGLYFSTLFPYCPLGNGGCGIVADNHFSEFSPELNVGSIDSFYVDCVRHKVRYIVLNNDASDLADFCSALYTGKVPDVRFPLICSVGDDKIFDIVHAQKNQENVHR
jgi:hypothetical protein